MQKLLVVVLTLAMFLTSMNWTTANAAAKPAFSKTSVTLLAGEKTTLKVKNKVSKADYAWKTSNQKVASVSKNGQVKAKAKGTATVTCTVKAKSKTYTLKCDVTVLKGATVVRISNKANAAVLEVGDSYDLNRTLYPKSSNDKTYWSSTDTSIASPDSGTSNNSVPVTCSVAGATITSNVPLELTATARITLVLNAGAEGTVIHVESEDLIPTIQGTVPVSVVIGTGETASTVTVSPVQNNTSDSNSSTPQTPSTPEVPSIPVTPTPEVTATLSGTVTTADATAVSGASIRIAKYDGSNDNYEQAVISAGTSSTFAVTDSEGHYSFDTLSPGHYVVLAITAGYQANVSTVEIFEDTNSTKDIVLTLLVDGDSSIGSASGTIYEAITNTPITVSGSSFKVVATDSNSIEYVATVTGSSYSFTDLPEGIYTVTVTDERTDVDASELYQPTNFSIFVLGGAVITGQNCYLSNSAEAGTATFVLTWGQYPWDLDSHLVGYDAAGQQHHIYYSNPTADATVTIDATTATGSSYDENAAQYDLRLDVDDIDSYGPETTSVYRCDSNNPWFTFFVYNYSGNDDATIFNFYHW